MRLLILFILGIALAYAVDTNAQNQQKWGLTAGWTEAYIADQHTSPLLYQSDLLTLGSTYQRPGNTTFLEISLLFQIGTHQARQLGKRAGVFTETPDLFGQQEAYDFVVNPFLSRFGGHLRIKALWPVSAVSQLGATMSFRYDLAGMAGDTWQFAQADLAPTFQYQKTLPTGKLRASLSLPILSGIVRPNWAVDPSLPDETNYFKGHLRIGSAITSVHQLFNPRVQLGYQHHLQNAKSLGFTYHFSWLSYPQPRPLRMLEHGVLFHYFW